jgi:DNA-binding MarR family transcriptional regulator
VLPGLGHELHALTARLDRAADGLLRRELGISYARFLALFAAHETNGTQRDMARWLGQSEPSTSRMLTVLADGGWVEVTRAEEGGNRRRVCLTDEGRRVIEQCGRLLEGRFEELVRASGVPYDAYRRHTRRLLDQLDDGARWTP